MIVSCVVSRALLAGLGLTGELGTIARARGQPRPPGLGRVYPIDRLPA